MELQGTYARRYISGPESKPLAGPDLDYLNRMIDHDFRELCDHVEVVWSEDDPYSSFEDMVKGFESGTLKVFSGGTPSPILSHLQNLKFRAVHDLHHVQCGGDFSFQGEMKAYRHVFKKWSLKGRLANFMFSEIVGQAAVALEFGYFPEQRTVEFFPDREGAR